MNMVVIRRHLLRASALIFALGSIVMAADQNWVRANLQAANNRKPAAKFVLKDSSGKTVRLKNFHGKVLLLDFWATWCHGCKQEIPWFSEFQKAYGRKEFAVVGVSMDEGGWSVVKPFLSETHVSYQMILGDDAMARRYGIKSLPDTFLIDRQGRVAAIYKEGLVDKKDVDANIRALLSER